ncbi:MAG: Rieske (2Fe-2S) protein [Acidobacteria bacterium]|jgi:cytochrome b6-f complex iron-sulfur subunit|nr:Rieske (2Fe-2S) protein [Acidobacteriota bacterium]
MTEGQRGSRRSFLWKAWLLLGGVAFAEAVWIVTDFFKPRRNRKTADEGGSVVVAGPVDRFEPGSVTAFPEGKFYLARLDDGGFLALHRECTHLGCTVPWIDAEHRFVCPCHASSFDITGNVLSPPAPRPLDTFPVRIENDIVKVDVRQAVRRRAFSESQVVRS